MALRWVMGRMTWLDRVIVVTLFALACGSFWFAAQQKPGSRVVVERDGEVLFTAPLDAPRTALLQGPLGETELLIRDGKACITSSPCPNKVCIGMGKISHGGEVVACVPNRLLVRVEGEKGDGAHDFISR